MSTLNSQHVKKRRILFEFDGVDGYFDMIDALQRRGHTTKDYVVALAVIDGTTKEIWIPKVKENS